MKSIISDLPESVIATMLATWIIMAINLIFRIVKSKVEFCNSEASKRFKDWVSANKDIAKEMKKSQKLYVLASRGNFLINDEGTNPYRDFIIDKNKDILILLPDVNDRCKKQNWIHQRVNEMKDLADSMIREDEQLIIDIKSTVDNIKKDVIYSDDCKNRDITFFDSLHLAKIILLDHVGYLQPYYDDKFGMKGVVYKYKSKTNMYKWLSRLIKNTNEFAVTIKKEQVNSCEKCPLYNDCDGGDDNDRN